MLSQCSLVAGRFTSGLKSITLITSGGVFAQAIIFLWILLKYRLPLCSCGVILLHICPIDELGVLESSSAFQIDCFTG